VDRYSELEAKYSANQLPFSRFRTEMDKLTSLKQPHVVVGWDTFYANPETGLVLRFRRAKSEGNDHPVLTYKYRKSVGADSVDRHEVDLFLENNDKVEEDTDALLTMALGCKKHFSILKESCIYHIEGAGHTAVIALYDVMVPGNNYVERFLEVEIDKDSPCTPEEGAAALAAWQEAVESQFDLQRPLGQSLYELLGRNYGDPELFIKGTF
jgi:adenylate cyclase class IV